jgi:hypothetical protein
MAQSRRYLGLDVLSKSRADTNPQTEQEDIPSSTNRLNHHNGHRPQSDERE